MNVDYFILCIISVITIVITYVSTHYEKDRQYKLIYLFFAFSFFMYSGVGIAIDTVSNIYILHYSLFLFLTLFFVSVTKKFVIGAKHHSYSSKIEKTYKVQKVERYVDEHPKVITLLTVFFLLTIVVTLIYPTNRLFLYFRPPVLSLAGIFDKQATTQNDVVLKLMQSVNVFLMPFFFIQIHSLIKKKKKLLAVLLVFFWAYSKMLSTEYMSRNEMLKIVIFIVLIATTYNEKTNEYMLSLRHYIVLGVLVLMAVPLLAAYTGYRQTGSLNIGSFEESIRYIIESECYYPEYFQRIKDTGSMISPITYFLWILFLPIPSIIWRGKPTIAINDTFTYSMYHITSAEATYSVSLPSLLGESFCIFGFEFFWIEAVVFGAILSLVMKWFKKYDYLRAYSLYYVVNLLTLARGGSQGYLSGLINGCVGLVLFNMYILHSYKR